MQCHQCRHWQKLRYHHFDRVGDCEIMGLYSNRLDKWPCAVPLQRIMRRIKDMLKKVKIRMLSQLFWVIFDFGFLIYDLLSYCKTHNIVFLIFACIFFILGCIHIALWIRIAKLQQERKRNWND